MTIRQFLFLLTSALLAGLFGAWLFTVHLAPAAAPTLSEISAHDLEARIDLHPAAERIVPSVVAVQSFAAPPLGLNSGSGVIISDDGLIATNHHVIAGSERIRITLHDRSEYWAERVGEDRSTDLALLRIDAPGDLPHATFGDSDSLRIGEWLLAVGNPFGLRSTVTAGILSARGRRIEVYGAADRIESFLQTDAAVNPGSSGGALINASGELVGINTAILSESGRHEGFNFAVPGNLAHRVLEDLRDYGEVRRASLGAYVLNPSPKAARAAGLERVRGVVINELVPGGASLRAGLEVGDLLVTIDDKDVESAQALQELLSQYRPGQQVRLTYIRGQRQRALTLTFRRPPRPQPRPVSRKVERPETDGLHRE